MVGASQKYVHEERITFEGIVMHLDPAHVSEDLEDQASEDSAGVTPCPPVEAEDQLQDEKEREDCKIEGVSA